LSGRLADWSLLTNHARLLLTIGSEPGLRQRDMAARLGLSERGVALILRDLRESGYVSAHREGRRTVYQVVLTKPLLGAYVPGATVGQFLRLFAAAEGEGAGPAAGHGFRSYYLRVRVAEAAQADALAAALEGKGAVVLEQERGIVGLLWPGTESDEPDEWDERTFAEAVLFLRSWSGEDPNRELIVLEERRVDLPEHAPARAS
jgi:hypothetical protein